MAKGVLPCVLVKQYVTSGEHHSKLAMPSGFVQLRYGKGVLGGASHAATFVRVYELLGPTFAGEYNAVSRVYPLHYPGLLFLFPIPPQYAQRCQDQAAELPLEFPDDTTPVASRICVYAGRAGVSCHMLVSSNQTFGCSHWKWTTAGALTGLICLRTEWVLSCRHPTSCGRGATACAP